MRRQLFVVLLLLSISTSIVAQQTIYWKKDHVYAGPGGPEIAIITPPTTDTTAPSAPTLNSPTTGYKSASLSWSTSTDTGGSGLAGYKIYRRIGTGANLPVGSTTGTTFTDEPLKPGVTYTFTIVAFDKAQNHSTPSSGVNVLTSSDTTAPAAPAGMAIAYTGPTSVSMTWSASTDSGGSGLQGYRVFRDGALVSPLIPGTTRMFVDTSLAANAAYTYEVRAVDNVGNESTGIIRSVFRDDFNRAAGTGLNSPHWATSGNWVISSNQASMSTTSGYESLSSKSFGSFNASVKTVERYKYSSTNPSSGLVFWSNDAGTEKYVINSTVATNGLTLEYVTPSQTYSLGSWPTVSAPYLLSVEADGSASATTRVIKASVNGFLQFSYTETTLSRRNSGRIGMRGVLTHASDRVKADEFQVVEKGASYPSSYTSTDIVPQNVRISYLSGTSVQVDWDASADIGSGLAGYEVFRGTTLVSGSNPISPTTFQNTGLTANTAYTYTVKAVDTPGTRFASLTKNVFRDDFNRSSAFLANAGWSTAGGWTTNGSTAQNIEYGSWKDALTAASVGSFRTTTNVTYVVGDDAFAVSGIVFWSNGSTGYRVGYDGLSYFTSSGGALLAGASLTSNGTLRVEANASTRVINVYFNSTLVISYAETDLSRPNSGKVGITALIMYDPECTPETCDIATATADDFFVEEQ